MKHRFLLDIMVIYFAIKEVREGEVPDRTCADLIQLIGQNCHSVLVDLTLKQRYERHLAELQRKPQFQIQTLLFFADLVYNSRKFIIETSNPPELPSAAAAGIPREDHYVVRAGLISNPIVVTAEKRLREAINANRDLLGLEAITPTQALELARDT